MFKRLDQIIALLETLQDQSFRVRDDLVEIKGQLDLLIGADTPSTPPVPVNGWENWWKLPREQYPSTINDLLVGYVLPLQDKVPLVYADNNNVLQIYESEELRGVTGSNHDGKRIIAKPTHDVMVYANGDAWSGAPNKACRPFTFDGGNLAYRVRREQNIDGIELWNHPELPKLYILASRVDVPFMPGG